MLETAIIGTGPYGLSIAAYLRRLGISYRIFGRPMDSWISHMPKGMMLKSDGFASNIYAPGAQFTLKEFCAERGIPYADMGTPVRLKTFTEYGLAFRTKMVPDLEEKLVTSVEAAPGGYMLGLDTGETVAAKRVILAVGITNFEHIPSNLQHLPSEFLTHSFQHSDPEVFRGRSVAVLGAGSSAIDLAGLLHEAGADVRLIARDSSLKFHEKMPMDKPRSLWQQVRSPLSGLGPGLSSRFFANFPNLFHHLPENYRLETVRTFLGPAGGWFAKDMVVGKVPLVLGCSVVNADISDHRVNLKLRGKDGSDRTLSVEHVIAATGYKVDLNRLAFLEPALRAKIQTAKGSPVLSSSFESSVPGLYFTGLAAANSFGPVMRFAFGAGYTSRHLSEVMAKSTSRGREWSTVSEAHPVKGS
jgi:thioredoxin reductase